MARLIILEMANNHSGSVTHGKKIIEAYSSICKEFSNEFEFVFKFQYRDLETFIRKDMKGNNNIPLIKRFSETKLSEEDFIQLIEHCKTNKFGVMVTPFDEISVEKAVENGVDYIKIASCSFGDWPLLEKIASTKKRVVASCAGADLDTIDNVVSFFLNRSIPFRLQHCVGEYPTHDENLNVGQVLFLKNKYSDLEIGFSSHENPKRTTIAPLALALGATSFEKHVALETDIIKKNAYSTSPDEFLNWIKSLSDADVILGDSETRYDPSIKESTSLRNLQRGVFINKDLSAGDLITEKDIYFAFPPDENQITANDFSKYSCFHLNNDLKQDSPLLSTHVEIENKRSKVICIAEDICDLINKSKLTVPSHADLEISHHYGIEKFRKFGLTMITVINREYCKKILILLPGQAHPEQYHNQKEETFHVLWGEGQIKIDGNTKDMNPGDVITILPKERHYFESKNGLIIEEISSTHFIDDSFYTDESIMQNINRKTFLSHWRIA